jgi:hypothetical protein
MIYMFVMLSWVCLYRASWNVFLPGGDTSKETTSQTYIFTGMHNTTRKKNDHGSEEF